VSLAVPTLQVYKLALLSIPQNTWLCSLTFNNCYIPQIGDEMPNFTTDSTVGMFNLHEIIDGSFAVRNLHW
jgi:hypothetical protein